MDQLKLGKMRVLLLLALAVVVVPFSQVECARILGIIPVASYSHQVPFQPLWRELSLRGHQVTVMTTNPVKDSSLTNLTEIDLSFTYEIYKKHGIAEFASDENKSFVEIFKLLRQMLSEVREYQLSHPQVLNLIHNKNVKFDLVIVEAQVPGMEAFSWRFNCPLIGVTSLDPGMQYHMAMGNPTHPMVNPDRNLPVEDPEEMTFKERISSLIYYIGYSYYIYYVTYPRLHEKTKEVFGDDVPDPATLDRSMAMLFINTHPIFHSTRPLNPNTITIGGGIQLQKPKELPQDIRKYLDNAKEGAIYFSLGTNANPRILNMTQVLMAFSELPYKVLLKTNLELKNIPVNVAIHKWLPQQDILRHPKLKLFITQGGLQSLQEAVYNAVPLVAIPILGDQIANVNRMVKKGYGIKINKGNVTKESLKEGILEVINNPKYRVRVQELREIFRAEEVPSLEKAVWWTEYIIKHGGEHLKSSVVSIPLWKYFMLDVIGLLLTVIILFVFICYRLTKLMFTKLFRLGSSKVKVQ